MSDDAPISTNPLAWLNGAPGWVWAMVAILGTGGVTFGVQQTAPEPVATQAEVLALGEQVEALSDAVHKLSGAVGAYHSGDRGRDDGGGGDH
jgi:hypothetical protein